MGEYYQFIINKQNFAKLYLMFILKKKKHDIKIFIWSLNVNRIVK